MFKKRNGFRHGASSVGSESGLASRTNTSTSSPRNAGTISSVTSTTTINTRKPKGSSLKNSIHSIEHENSKGRVVSDGSRGSKSGGSTRSSAVTKKHVQFSRVEMREFERVLTNNPSCSSGAPIGLGWGYVKGKTIDLDDYESMRTTRRSQLKLVLSRQEREAIMMEWGASVHEIVEAIRGNVRAKHQRRHSVNSIGRYDRLEEMMQSASRRLKRTILLQKPTGQKAQELSAQVQPCCLSSKDDPQTDAGESDAQIQPEDVQDVPQHRPPNPKKELPEQHPKAAAFLQMHSLYSPDEYIMGMSDPGLHEISPVQYVSNPPECRSYHGAMFKPAAPVTEVNIEETTEVQSYLTYDDDAVSVDSSVEEDPNDDGFGELFRDTRHWYVDGFDAPHPQRRVIPTVISEDYNFSYYSTGDYQPQHPVVSMQTPPALPPQKQEPFLLHHHYQSYERPPQSQDTFLLHQQVYKMEQQVYNMEQQAYEQETFLLHQQQQRYEQPLTQQESFLLHQQEQQQQQYEQLLTKQEKFLVHHQGHEMERQAYEDLPQKQEAFLMHHHQQSYERPPQKEDAFSLHQQGYKMEQQGNELPPDKQETFLMHHQQKSCEHPPQKQERILVHQQGYEMEQQGCEQAPPKKETFLKLHHQQGYEQKTTKQETIRMHHLGDEMEQHASEQPTTKQETFLTHQQQKNDEQSTARKETIRLHQQGYGKAQQAYEQPGTEKETFLTRHHQLKSDEQPTKKETLRLHQKGYEMEQQGCEQPTTKQEAFLKHRQQSFEMDKNGCEMDRQEGYEKEEQQQGFEIDKVQSSEFGRGAVVADNPSPGLFELVEL